MMTNPCFSGVSLRVSEARLHYPSGEEVHTAASGRVDALHEIFLEIGTETGFCGLGEIRANIAFITGTPESRVLPGIVGLLRAIDWRKEPAAILRDLPMPGAGFPKISRALVENALVDGLGRAEGRTACSFLGGAWQRAVPCNQCIFWGDDAAMHRLAERYWAEGFRSIKLRVGIGTLDDDHRRAAWLRERFGDDLHLAVDANGAWTPSASLAAIARLGPLGIDYVEQPTSPGDWGALEEVGRATDIPIMIDEGLQGEHDIALLCRQAPRFSAHLKIAKAGGALAMVKIGRRLDRHGVSYVVGQMNEGTVATATAIHCAMALKPMFGELYGALGLLDDPASGVSYAGGQVSVRERPGFGVSFDPSLTRTLWISES
ncbi:mandelate racemase/muconate lactonizing enzyme family protein [Bradyrhizobium prioriisuperbiae]|uniref:mandelate racemase/muconate lactonizing enzyme family protein n=1 Tax=Bradyrhizobium prioriisuperbiae TaxID=2854389 RepID=UPI0028EDADA4|nr:mandelate racemase/muconate lactonizing enzyme family protein [Bradyrhizobium prioritasuperba]